MQQQTESNNNLISLDFRNNFDKNTRYSLSTCIYFASYLISSGMTINGSWVFGLSEYKVQVRFLQSKIPGETIEISKGHQVHFTSNIPTAIVLMNSRPPFSRKTVWFFPDWSPSISITSAFVFGEQKDANTSNRSVLESIIGPVTCWIGRCKYLRKVHIFQLVLLAKVTFLLLVGVYDVLASTSSQYIQLWLILSFSTWTHFHIVKEPISFLSKNDSYFSIFVFNPPGRDALLQESHIYWTTIGSTHTRIS